MPWEILRDYLVFALLWGIDPVTKCAFDLPSTIFLSHFSRTVALFYLSPYTYASSILPLSAGSGGIFNIKWRGVHPSLVPRTRSEGRDSP
jgi:hypothetical protein